MTHNVLLNSIYRAHFSRRVLLPLAITIGVCPHVSWAQLPARKTSPPSRQKRFAEMNMRRLVVNGVPQGRMQVVEVDEARKKVLMVPFRVMMEMIHWKVGYEAKPVEESKDYPAPMIGASAPFYLKEEHQDDPYQGDLRAPGFFLSLVNGNGTIFSPQLNMGESLQSRPLPKIVDGQVYVSLATLQEAAKGGFRQVKRADGTLHDEYCRVSITYDPKTYTVYADYSYPFVKADEAGHILP